MRLENLQQALVYAGETPGTIASFLPIATSPCSDGGGL
jgi:hypothetical protein